MGLCACGLRVDASETAEDAKQIVVCLAPDLTSSEGTLQLFHRDDKGQWVSDAKPWPVLFGMKGLAWGRGINPPQPGPQKVEGDHKNPMGLFKIGPVYGYAPALPDGAKDWPYHQVTDPRRVDRHAGAGGPRLQPSLHAAEGFAAARVVAEGAHAPRRPRLHMLVLIEHNYEDAQPHAGTEIYFHVRRGEHYRTAGCTTMELDRLEQLVKWLDPDKDPMVVELTRAEYARLWKDWQLPPPS